MLALSTLHQLAIVPEMLFAGIARQGPPETRPLTPFGSEHELPVPAGMVAVAAGLNDGDETRVPVLACRVQLFEQSSPDGQNRSYRAMPALIGANGEITEYDHIVFADGSTGFLDFLTDDEPDELLRRAQAGRMFVDPEEEEAERLDWEEQNDA
ncbi:hypothetical protein [Paraburkholderia aspalathi]|uniref:hypothetical protein n=1 Tax=Paraburkholderia aspalathi TaxID=1324617 RepID=UPI001B02DE17|nr:hypothetical protein [Paraburkholderia aspalathi]CAE6826805.1 hypothetical protein R20943_06441 [Paraburkholderia aspalathi]